MSTVTEKLARELRMEAHELSFLRELDEAQLALVLDGLQSAAATQKRQIETAIEQSLSHVPRLLHGPIRRILFGQK